MVVKSLQTTDFTQHFHFMTQKRKPTGVERLAWVTWLAGGRVRGHLSSISWTSAFKAPTLEHYQLPALNLFLLPGFPNIIGWEAGVHHTQREGEWSRYLRAGKAGDQRHPLLRLWWEAQVSWGNVLRTGAQGDGRDDWQWWLKEVHRTRIKMVLFPGGKVFLIKGALRMGDSYLLAHDGKSLALWGGVSRHVVW